jgi:hypothetical protein
MTLQTLFTNWPPYSSWEYPGQSRLVAYFSMEIAITPAMPTYSGGLGVLAGDTLRAAADMGFRWLRSRWLTARAMSSSVWMRTVCSERKISRGIWKPC